MLPRPFRYRMQNGAPDRVAASSPLPGGVKAVAAVADSHNVGLNRRLEEAHTTVGRVTLMIPGRLALDDGPQGWCHKLLHQNYQVSDKS